MKTPIHWKDYLDPENSKWFVYRFWIDDRIYFVVRTPAGTVRTGWLRSDGEEFGGYFEVFARWLSLERTYQVRTLKT